MYQRKPYDVKGIEEMTTKKYQSQREQENIRIVGDGGRKLLIVKF